LKEVGGGVIAVTRVKKTRASVNGMAPEGRLSWVIKLRPVKHPEVDVFFFGGSKRDREVKPRDVVGCPASQRAGKKLGNRGGKGDGVPGGSRVIDKAELG